MGWIMSSSEYTEIIQLILQRDNPRTVYDVIKKAEKEHNIPGNKTIETIEILRENKKIKLLNTNNNIPKNILKYILTINSTWFWFTITLSLLLPISTLFNLDYVHPFLYIRLISNIIFLLFLPGHSLTKILFIDKEIDHIERITYSLGISIILVPMVGFLLNFSTWGITFYPLTVGLSTITIILATIGVIIEHRHRLS